MNFHKEDFESVVCDFCGADDYIKRYEKRGFWMVQCNKCGLVYTNPRLKQEKIAALYDADYFQGHGFDKSIDYVKDVKEHSTGKDDYTLEDWDSDNILALLRESQTPNATPQLLEIGCGTGMLLFRLAAHCSMYSAGRRPR